MPKEKFVKSLRLLHKHVKSDQQVNTVIPFREIWCGSIMQAYYNMVPGSFISFTYLPLLFSCFAYKLCTQCTYCNIS